MAHGEAPRAVAERLGPAPAPRMRRDWSARTRAGALETERYTRFVVIAKRVLLVAAAVLIAAIVAFSLQPRQSSNKRLAMTFQRLGIVNNDLAMIKPRLTGADDEGDPYVVTAEVAVQDRLNAKRARLKVIQGDVTLKGGTWISATAPSGLLDATHPAQQKMMLAGPIAVFSDNGYEIHTMRANIDMGSGTITGDSAVSGQGPLGVFRADRFRVDRRRKVVYLDGNVRMTIYGQRMRGS